MRIRKNAKLSPLLYSHGGSAPEETTFQTHVCQLNQSPWDVIPFASDSNQFEAEDSFPGNNAGDSAGAVESVASMMDIDDKKLAPKIEDRVVNHNDNIPPPPPQQKSSHRGDKDTKSFSCQKTDGKGWHCKNKAKPGQSFCDHHYAMLKSYNHNSSNGYHSKKSAAAAAAATASARRPCSRQSSKKSSSSSNPYEFYYYSGFGPSWGKRRGDRSEKNDSKTNEPKPCEDDNNTDATAGEDDDGDAVTAANVCNSNGQSSSSHSSELDNDNDDNGFGNYVDDCDDDDDEGNGESGKKRMRKPVKARSLKSLM